MFFLKKKTPGVSFVFVVQNKIHGYAGDNGVSLNYNHHWTETRISAIFSAIVSFAWLCIAYDSLFLVLFTTFLCSDWIRNSVHFPINNIQNRNYFFLLNNMAAL